MSSRQVTAPGIWTSSIAALLVACGARSTIELDRGTVEMGGVDESEGQSTGAPSTTVTPRPLPPVSSTNVNPRPLPTPSPRTEPPATNPPVPTTSVPTTPVPTTSVPTTPVPTTSVPTPNPVTPSDPGGGWATCINPLTLGFAPGGGGTYTSFSTDATDTANTVCSKGDDVMLRWTAPESGFYAFSTENTAYDATLALYEDGSGCDAPLACQRGFTLAGSYLEHYAEAGESYLMAVEASERGRFSLAVTPIDRPGCSPMDLGSEVPLRYVGNFIEESTAHAFTSHCNSSPRSVSFLFTPPADGTYRFSTEGTAFDSVLVVSHGCFDEPLGCNDDGPFDLSSRLDLSLAQNESVVVFVAAIGGGRVIPGSDQTYVLNIEGSR